MLEKIFPIFVVGIISKYLDVTTLQQYYFATYKNIYFSNLQDKLPLIYHNSLYTFIVIEKYLQNDTLSNLHKSLEKHKIVEYDNFIKSKKRLYIPLDFALFRSQSLHLPMIALPYKESKIHINLAPID